MWRRSIAAALIRSSLRRRPPIRHLTPQTLTLTPPLPINPRFFSSIPNPAFSSTETGTDSPDPFPNHVSADAVPETWDLSATDDPFASFTPEKSGDENADVDGESLSSLWDETVAGGEDFAAEEPTPNVIDAGGDVAVPGEVSKEKLESLIYLLLQDELKEPLSESLEMMELAVSEEFVLKVIETPDVVGENLIGFVKWAMKKDASLKSSKVVSLLVAVITGSDVVKEEDATLVWDLVKKVGKEEGVVTSGILNAMVLMFWKLRKRENCCEVFEKFDEFGCEHDASVLYIRFNVFNMLEKVGEMTAVTGKMCESGSLPGGGKLRGIIISLCNVGKYEEAIRVYLKAREMKICVPAGTLSCLINRLSRGGENVAKALDLLESYWGECPIKSFTWVLRGLCLSKNVKRANELLLKMADSGPPPGHDAFNIVITELCKEGEMDEALAILKLMESRGLKPEVYTYSIIMNGFVKGGLMDEAHKVFHEAKQRHAKLSRLTYRILIRGYCKMEEYDKAMECFKEMKEDGTLPNPSEYEILINTLGLKALNWRECEKLLEEMKERNLRIKPGMVSLIEALKEVEDEEVAAAAAGVELESK